MINNKQQGLGMVELMISITVGLVIMAGVIQMFATTSENAYSATATARLQENIRYAFSRIGDDIAQAGNYRCGDTPVVNGLINITALGWNDFAGSYVSGVNGDEQDAATPDDDDADTLIVKYIDMGAARPAVVNSPTQLTSAGAGFANGDVVLAGHCGAVAVLQATNNVTLTMGAGLNHELVAVGAGLSSYAGNTGAYTYFIGNTEGGNCANNVTQCALRRAFNGGGTGANQGEELLQGVSNLQVRYGVIDNAGALNYSDAPTLFGAPKNYQNVDRVQVSMTFNATAAAGQVISRTVTRVFAIRNPWI